MKIFKRVILIILSLVILIVLSVFIFFRTAPQIGGKAKGARLERMKQSPNYKEGIFLNTVETNMDMPFSTLRKVMKEYLFGDKSKKSPKRPIQTRPFSAASFEAAADSVVAITWFGHSSLLIKVDGRTILMDPVLVGERASMFSFMGPQRFPYNEHISIDQLPDIDAVIISHDHYDHLDYPSIKVLKDKVSRFYMPLGVGAHFVRWGVPEENITELEWWEETVLKELRLVLTPTRHFSGRGLGDRFHTLWGSWVILGKEKKIYFSGDSGYFPGFKEIGEKYGPFDLTFMECGAYNEGWSEIHMFPEQTAQAHLDVQGKLLMPIHWGKFDLSLHPWKESVQRLHDKAQQENISLFTPEIGQLITLADSSETRYWWEEVD